MILVDANLLLFAYDKSSPFHTKAKSWLESLYKQGGPVGLSWFTILAFVRISTNPRVFEFPLSPVEALNIAGEWLVQPPTVLLEPGERYWKCFRRAVEEGQAAGPMVADASLAALAVEHGATLATHDRDFAKFPDLKLLDPLQDS